MVFIEPSDFSFFSITAWGIDLDYSVIEWFALEMNSDHSVVFQIVPKYCILVSFVDCDGYSIYSKGFLPTVVDIMVRLVQFSCSVVSDSFIEYDVYPISSKGLLPMVVDIMVI